MKEIDKPCRCEANECRCLSTCPFEVGRFLAPQSEKYLRENGYKLNQETGRYERKFDSETMDWAK